MTVAKPTPEGLGLWSLRDIQQYTGCGKDAVKRWYERREDTGFPEIVIRQKHPGGGDKYLFDEDEVRQWWDMWRGTRRRKYGSWQSSSAG
jgi:hypothetical protein